MATVFHYQYTFYLPGFSDFMPGAAHAWVWGPWNWFKKGVLITAQPFAFSTADRTLSVRDVHVRSIRGDYYVEATIQNVGRDPIKIYYISLTEIAP